MPRSAMSVAERRAVLFDFDGTLANSVPAILDTARTALLAHGFSEDELGDLTRLVGPPFPGAFELVYGLSAEEALQVTTTYRSIYTKLGRAGWPLYDGMAELLRRLRAEGRLTAVASSKRNDMIERALVDNDATGLFDVSFGKLLDEAETKASIIGRALEALGVTPDEAVMVGDRRFDVEAAHARGIPCVGVLYGGAGSREELERAGADVIAETVEELGEVLLGLR